MSKEIKRRAFLLGSAGLFLAGCRVAATPTASSSTQIPPTATTPPPTPTDLPPTPVPPTATQELPTATVPPPTIEGASTQVGYQLPLVTRYAGMDRAVFYFALAQQADARLLVWETDNPGTVVEIDVDGGLIDVQGLRPGIHHTAVVAVIEDDTYRTPFYTVDWPQVTFSTLSERPLRVGVIGDAGFGDSVTVRLVERMAAANLDFTIHTGDVVYRVEENADAREAWRIKWYETFAPVLQNMPVYPVMGNHDYDAPARWADSYYYYTAIPPLTPADTTSKYYSFPFGDMQFIFLDSQVFFGQPGRQEQEAWLDERLADPAFRHTIPVFHVAAYTSGRRRDSDAVPVRQTWGPKFNAANVPIAFSGHDHNYERLIIEGTTYVVSGGGSAVLYGLTEEYPGSQIFDQIAHVVFLEITTDSISLEAVNVEGTTIDTATISLV